MVTEEDLAARDPLILTDKEVNLTEHHKSLMRKNPKFCPTPTKPIDVHGHYQDFISFRESVRWAYFFAKENDFKPQENNSYHQWDFAFKGLTQRDICLILQ